MPNTIFIPILTSILTSVITSTVWFHILVKGELKQKTKEIIDKIDKQSKLFKKSLQAT